MKKQTERLIKEMVRRIVEQFNPEKVILLGSYARGTAGPESDVDLLVVMHVSLKGKVNSIPQGNENSIVKVSRFQVVI